MFQFSRPFSSETFPTVRRTQRDVIINIYQSSCKVLLILVRFQWSLYFLDVFSKNI